MTSVVFVVPAHGRFELTRVCLRALRRTCDTLVERGIGATAVVGADDQNLEAARDCGFGTVERENAPLGRKWNDLYASAAELGATHIVPVGSDDWVHPDLFTCAPMPGPSEIGCHRLSTVVSEDRSMFAGLRIPYDGGDGVRIFPRELLEPLRFRPAEEDAPRAIDTSIFRRLLKAHGRMPRLVYRPSKSGQIVDWKTRGAQLNSYQACLRYAEFEMAHPYEHLAFYPAGSLEEMQALDRVAVAA